MHLLVRSLTARDAAPYQALRLQALRDSPASFSASYDDEAGRSLAEIEARVTPAEDGSVCMFGAFADETLVGFVAFVRPQRAKLAHCAELAGMYVAEAFRRRGLGQRLIEALASHARAIGGVRQLKLGVARSNAAARRLYEAAGFAGFGVEPDALRVDGVFHDQEHFVLRLT